MHGQEQRGRCGPVIVPDARQETDVRPRLRLKISRLEKRSWKVLELQLGP